MPRTTSRLARVAVATALLVGAAGTAYAFWGTIGSGGGSADAGQLQTLTTEASVQPSGQSLLAPGTSADVVVRVANPNPYEVQLYSVTADGAATPDAGHPQCVTTGVSFQAPAAPIAPQVSIPANATQTVTLSGAASMDLSSDPGCQGAVFRLPLTLEVRK